MAIDDNNFDPLAYQSKGLAVTEQFVLVVTIIGEGATNLSEGSHLVTQGYEVQVTATPSNNFLFDHWEEYPEITSNTIQITMDSNKTITPVFEIIDGVILDVVVIGDGTLSGSSNGIYSPGDTIILDAIPSIGWEFIRWVNNGITSSKRTKYTHDITNNELIKLVFQKRFYGIDTYITGSGLITPLISDRAYYGQVLDFTATPIDGAQFVQWEGSYDGTDNTASITINEDVLLGAVFTNRKYVIDADIIGNGIIEINPLKESYDYNEQVTISAIPDDGYVFKEWFGNLVGNHTAKLAIVNDMSIVAKFIEIS